MGSGILPVAIHNDKFYFLFSREVFHKNDDDNDDTNRWSDFGGKKENNESDKETAVRECFEESGGFIGNEKKLTYLVNKNCVATINCYAYKTYIVMIDYDETLPERFEKDFNNIKKINPDKICKDGLYEKDKLKWIEFSELNLHNNNFRKHYRRIINKILNMKAFKLL